MPCPLHKWVSYTATLYKSRLTVTFSFTITAWEIVTSTFQWSLTFWSLFHNRCTRNVARCSTQPYISDLSKAPFERMKSLSQGFLRCILSSGLAVKGLALTHVCSVRNIPPSTLFPVIPERNNKDSWEIWPGYFEATPPRAWGREFC